MELVIIIILVVLIIYLLADKKECYTSKNEKAEVITDWFNKQKSPTYEKYKDSIQGSDVLEYSDVKKMKEGGRLNVNNVANVIA